MPHHSWARSRAGLFSSTYLECLNLKDVKLEVGDVDLRLEGGLCLLSQWTRLEKLPLLVSADSSVCKDTDLDRMKVGATFWQRTMRIRQVGRGESSLKIETKEMEAQKNRVPNEVREEAMVLGSANNHGATVKESVSVPKLRLLGRLADVKEALEGIDAAGEQFHCWLCLEAIEIKRKGTGGPKDVRKGRQS